MRSFLFGQLIRSLLIGVVAIGITVWLYWSGLGLTIEGTRVKYQLALAWVALSIGGSYVWHTRRLDRKTVAGTVSEILMWLLYALLLLLALRIWFFMPEPFDPNKRPFMD